MSRIRGISEKKFWLGNPFPAGHTQQSLAEAAGFKSMRGFSSQEFFRITWKYDSGPTGELIVLEPDAVSEAYNPGASDVKEIEFAFRDDPKPPIILERPNDRQEILEKSLVVIEKALDTYTREGTEFIEHYQMLNQLNEKQLENARWEIRDAFINQQVERILSERLDWLRERLQSGGAPAAA